MRKYPRKKIEPIGTCESVNLVTGPCRTDAFRRMDGRKLCNRHFNRIIRHEKKTKDGWLFA